MPMLPSALQPLNPVVITIGQIKSARCPRLAEHLEKSTLAQP